MYISEDMNECLFINRIFNSCREAEVDISSIYIYIYIYIHIYRERGEGLDQGLIK